MRQSVLPLLRVEVFLSDVSNTDVMQVVFPDHSELEFQVFVNFLQSTGHHCIVVYL